eukprot:1282587-Prymnesium_polylepis.1
MLGPDGAWFRASHALRCPPIPLPCVWREFLKSRPPGNPPLKEHAREVASLRRGVPKKPVMRKSMLGANGRA